MEHFQDTVSIEIEEVEGLKCEVFVEDHGRRIRATVDEPRITIAVAGVWAGQGFVSRHPRTGDVTIIDCPTDLADDVYERLEAAISAAAGRVLA